MLYIYDRKWWWRWRRHTSCYMTCVSIGKTSGAPGLEGACQTNKYIFFFTFDIYIYIIYVHDFFSVSFYILLSLPSCVEAIRNRTTDIIYLTCGQSIYTHIHIRPYWFMAPGATVRRYHHQPPTLLYLSVVIILYIDSDRL